MRVLERVSNIVEKMLTRQGPVRRLVIRRMKKRKEEILSWLEKTK